MRRYWILVSGICLAGCLGNNGLWSLASSERNVFNLTQIHEGMSQREVLRVMHKPYDYQTITIGDDVYDIWFYVTRMTGLGQTRMVYQNMTPLTFKNGILVGWGYMFYDDVLKQQMAANNPPPPKQEENPENEGIEKALEVPPGSNKTPPTNPQTPPNQLPGRSPDQDNPLRNQPQQPAKPGQQVNPGQPPKPGQPQKPPAPPKKQVSMAKSPADSEEIDPSEPPPEKEEEPFDEKGNRMLQDESEENFDYW